MTTKQPRLRTAEVLIDELTRQMVLGTEPILLDATVRAMAEVLSADTVIVSRCHDLTFSANSQAIYDVQGRVGQLTYELKGTPCAEVVTARAPVSYPAQIQQLFPDDRDLQVMGLNAYAGVPLLGADDEIVGLCCCLWADDQEDIALYAQVLEAVAPRLACEVQRKVLEEERQGAVQEGRRLKMIFDAEPECVKVVDPQGNLLDMNPAGIKMIEARDLDQVRGLPITDLVVPCHHGEFQESLARVLAGHEDRRTFEIVGLNGTRRWMEQVAVPILEDGEGSPVVEMLAVTRDISRHVQMLEELKAQKIRAEEANVAKSQFLANMSHEIRTPLNGILGMSQVLRRQKLEKTPASYVETIINSGEGLLSVLNDVLDLSKVESGTMELQMMPHDVAAATQSAGELWTPKAAEKGLALEIHVAQNTPAEVVADGHRLRQCIDNLISNAIKFTDHGSVAVYLGATQTDNGSALTLEVKDTGIGIEADQLDALFLPFVQADGTTTRRHGGTGLGLSIARTLITKMGGTITAKSAVGQGTSFSILLPCEFCTAAVTGGPQDPSVPECPPSTATAAIRILLADDNALNREVAKALLTPVQAHIVEAANGQEAIDLVEAGHKFDVILMDIHMPVMDGYEFTQRLREASAAWRTTPVLALTADAMQVSAETLAERGFDGYIPKPISEAKLLAEVAAMLDAKPTVAA